MQRLMRRKEGDEVGGVATVVALLAVPILVCLAFVVDAGLLHWEKVQLQNGADAAALAVAEMCAKDGASCMSGASGLATGIAGRNANDTQAAASLPASEFVVGDSSGKVTVDTSTLNSEGVEVRHPFASLVTPGGSTIAARAKAEWGTPIRGTTEVALTIAECEFDDLPAQAADATNPTRTWLLINNGPANSQVGAPCADGSPGGFGWLDGTNCHATIAVDATVGGEVGVQPNPNKNGCSADVLAGKLCDVLLIPLYSATTGSGGNAMFTISRFAAFKLTGVKTSGNNDVYCGGSPLDPPVPSPAGNSKGIQGYFVEYVELGEDYELGEGAPDGELTIVKLAD